MSPEPAPQYGALPLTFEANVGQTDGRVRFLARGGGYTLFLTGEEAVLSLRRADGKSAARARHDVLRIGLAGANRAPRVVGVGEQPGTSNYLIGNDPSKWRTNVPHYAKVRYEDVYPGIDLVYYGNERRLEHDFVVAAGADPGVIRLKFAGARKIRTDAAGNLVLKTKAGEVALQAPVVYQEIRGERRPVAGRYQIAGKNEAAFEVGTYDRRLALVIDPVLVYSTYLGGSGAESCGEEVASWPTCGSIAVDSSGSAYVTGLTGSLNFPTTVGAHDTTLGGSTDAYVTKLSPSGSTFVYSTYLGGTGDDLGYGIALGPSGSVYVAGATRSTDFPATTGAYDTTLGGTRDAFVARLDATGSALVYATYLGGTTDDAFVGDQYTGEVGRAVAVDGSGAAYVTGYTASSDFPTAPAGSALMENQPERDAFITKLAPAGDSLVYSTHVGGADIDVAVDIAVDASGNAYVTGFTYSGNMPTTANAYDDTFAGGTDAFVSGVNAGASNWLFSTYLGGSELEIGYGIAVDAAGDVYVAGSTDTTRLSGIPFPIVNAYQPDLDNWNAFVTKFDMSASTATLAYSTYLGGAGVDYGYGLALGPDGSAYVTGGTSSADFPLLNASQGALNGSSDAFVAKLGPGGDTLGYSTYLGGSGSTPMEAGLDVALDGIGNAYVTGRTYSSDFPTLNAAQTAFGGGTTDAFVARFGDSIDLAVLNVDSPDPVLVGGTLTYTVTVTNNGPGTASNVRMTETLGAILSYSSASGGNGCSVAGQLVTCNAATLAAGASVVFTITAVPGDGASTGTSTAQVAADQPDSNSSNNTDLAVTVLVPAANLGVTMSESGDPWPAGGLSYVVRVTNAGPSAASDVVLTNTLGANVTLNSVPTGCTEASGVLTCNLGSIAASGVRDTTISLTATRGATMNSASVTAGTTDPVVGNNSASESTLVYETQLGNELPFLTATARSDRIVLEWLNPPEPYESAIVRYTPPPTLGCTPPASPSDGQPLAVEVGAAGTHDSYEHNPVLPAVDYCYSVFVHKGDGLISGAKTVKARAVPASGPVRWAYTTGAAALAPVAVGSAANAVSNDSIVHAMVRGSGATAGQWPEGWTPFEMSGPPQHRPTSMPITSGSTTTRQIILNSQDGRMYSVDAASGAPLWQTADFGTLQAGTSAWLRTYGAPSDYLIVGTRNTSENNRLLAIDPATSAEAWSYSNLLEPIGPISGQATVDYDLRVVYFTSAEYSAGAQTVWCVNLDSPHNLLWSRALGSSTGSPTARNGVLYVGTSQGGGTVYALNASSGTQIWSYPTGDGEPNGFIMPDRWTDDIYFSTATRVWSLSDSAGPVLNWSTTAVANPTAPLYTTDDKLLYVGSTNGRLWQIDTTQMPNEELALESVLLDDPGKAIGAPTRDNPNDLIYVGSESGVIYAVQQPLP